MRLALPLDSSKLARGLLQLTVSFPRDPTEAGRRWSHAYALYAADALSPPPTAAPPNSLDPGEQVLAAALAATWTTSVVAPQTAQQIATALTAFWFAPPVTFGAGVVTVVGGGLALPAALLGVWVGNQAGRLTPEECTRNVADVVHAFTLTVITTTPSGGGPVVGPIS